MIRLAVALVGVLALGCSGSPGGPMNNKMGGGADTTPQSSSVVSQDILFREPVANNARVKHILISWKDLDPKDPRGQARTKADAEAQVKSLMGQISAGGNFDALMTEHSEDPGSKMKPEGYDVSPDAQLVIEFKQLSLRLEVNEVGVVQTEFGFHIIKRVK